LSDKELQQRQQKKREADTSTASSTLFLVERKKPAEKDNDLLAERERTRKIGRSSKLQDEVQSWRSFARALRIEDRQLLNHVLEKIWPFDGAVESCKEGYETEAFLLGLLILQQKTIDRLEAMIGTERKKKKNDSQ
jgi:hypothetical protein